MTGWTSSLGALSKRMPSEGIKRKSDQKAKLNVDIEAYLASGGQIETVECQTPENVASRRVGMPKNNYF